MRGNARLGCGCLLLIFNSIFFIKAGPVNYSMSSRLLNTDRQGYEEITEKPEDFNIEITRNLTIEGGCIFGINRYLLGDSVPSAKPCEDCTCTENGIQCSPIGCEVRPGCKALHRADHCCPLYQCECERNGITYSNGEKLVDPENPCQVCYCQGGEIVCNQIACFRRDDCEPRYVPGRCCPEYEHCPPRDKINNSLKDNEPLQKIEPQKVTDVTTPDYFNIDKTITENIKQFLLDDESNFSLEHRKVLSTKSEVVDEEKSMLNNNNSSKPIVISLNESNKIFPTLNIKEVTGINDKPNINNEIRIKEILPIHNKYDVNDPKSPTFPREASYAENNKDELKNNRVPNLSVKNTNNTDNVYQTPPILRIGDQLLFLNQGDFIQEKSYVHTPAPVFTVIGAEGLQRVIDEAEDSYDANKQVNIEDTHIQEDENNTKNYVLSNDNLFSNESIDNINNSNAIPMPNENTEQLLMEVMSELYATTTVSYSGYMENSSKKQKIDISNSNNDSINESSSSEYTTSDVSKSTIKYINSILDEEQQPIPIEHLPEHNPEYPPIPEDIMILGMTEDSLDSVSSEDYSGPNPIHQESKNEEEIIIVKGPILSNSNILKDNERILPDVLDIVKMNKTNGTNLVPEEWLKSKDVVHNDEKGSLALPDELLLLPSYKDSKEIDDSKDYIFIKNNPIESSKKKSFENSKLPENTELKSEIKSPGEPLLIPEWERNQTEVSEDTSTTFSNLEENFTDILKFTEENKSKVKFLNSDRNLIKKSNINEDIISQYKKTDDILSINNIVTKSQLENNLSEENEKNTENSSTDSFTEDPYTNLIISTENSFVDLSTDDLLDVDKSVMEKESKELSENEKIIREDDLLLFNVNSPTKKQKKTPPELKSTNIETSKKGNILADLISLVGDVASIGNHESELSTVHNSIESEKQTTPTEKNIGVKSITKDYTSTTKFISTNSHMTHGSYVEFPEFISEGNNDEIPIENEKVEFTTKKMIIDKENDGRQNWTPSDQTKKDVEIIPKVDNKVKNSSLEKIIENVQSQNVIENKKSHNNNVQESVKSIIDSNINNKNLTKKLITSNILNEENLKALSNNKAITTEEKRLLANILMKMISENEETAINSDQTVMKVSTKSDTSALDRKIEDKLTNLENNYQMDEPTDNNHLISVLRKIFEKQYKL